MNLGLDHRSGSEGFRFGPRFRTEPWQPYPDQGLVSSFNTKHSNYRDYSDYSDYRNTRYSSYLLRSFKMASNAESQLPTKRDSRSCVGFTFLKSDSDAGHPFMKFRHTFLSANLSN
jgi:hypothetical protein